MFKITYNTKLNIRDFNIPEPTPEQLLEWVEWNLKGRPIKDVVSEVAQELQKTHRFIEKLAVMPQSIEIDQTDQTDQIDETQNELTKALNYRDWLMKILQVLSNQPQPKPVRKPPRVRKPIVPPRPRKRIHVRTGLVAREAGRYEGTARIAKEQASMKAKETCETPSW